MTIPKQQIVDFLRSRGQDGFADQAQSVLPEDVDIEQYKDKLAEFGINNPADLLGKLPGGIGEKLGGLGGLLG